MANDEQPQIRKYVDSLMDHDEWFRATTLGPVGPNPFGRIRDRDALDVLRSWKSNQLRNDHPIKNMSVYSYIPDILLKRYDPEEKIPVWMITHVFRAHKYADHSTREVDHEYKLHWGTTRTPNPKPIMEPGNPVPIGSKLKLALFGETYKGSCRQTAYKMDEYSLHNHPYPPSERYTNHDSALYKGGDWVNVKLYKGKSKKKYMFGGRQFLPVIE